MLFGRVAARCARGTRQMSGVVEKAAAGEVQVWRPKVQVTRHLSPHEMEVVSSPAVYFKKQGNAFVENLVDWLPGAVFFFAAMQMSSHYHAKWAREHAIHGGGDD